MVRDKAQINEVKAKLREKYGLHVNEGGFTRCDFEAPGY